MEAAEEARAWFDKEFDADEVAAPWPRSRSAAWRSSRRPDIERFRTAVKPVYDKYADKVGGWKMIQAVLDTK